MHQRIHLIVHHATELAALLQACQQQRAKVFAVREHTGALVFEIDPAQACELYRHWRQPQPVAHQAGAGMLEQWLSAAQAACAHAPHPAVSSTAAGVEADTQADKLPGSRSTLQSRNLSDTHSGKASDPHFGKASDPHFGKASAPRSDKASEAGSGQASDLQADTKSGQQSATASAAQLVRSFRGQDCRAMRFVQQDLRGADFSDADLRGVDFSGANLQGALFQRAQLGLRNDAGWLAAAMRRSFTLLGGWGWHYWQRNLTNLGTRFRGCDLSGADFSGASIGVVNFHAANLARCNWRGASWRGPLWGSDTRLHQPDLMALLCQGSRQQRDFSHQDLSRLDLSWLDLSGFDLRHAVLNDAIVSHARLSGADIRSMQSNAATRWEQVDCDHWSWPDLEGGRWPPLPDRLAEGDVARWLGVAQAGLVLLAYSVAELQAWLQVLAPMGLRLQQIRWVEAASSDPAQPWFQIAVQTTETDLTRLCKQAWQRKMALPAAVPEPQLQTLFAPLMPDCMPA